MDLKGSSQAFSFSPIIDNTQVIHHWFLYQSSSLESTGVSAPCLGFDRGGPVLAGWAPGAGAWTFPPDVGVGLSSGDFVLEVQYENVVLGHDVTDASGVRMCAGKTPRRNTAGVSWLGNDAFGASGNPGIPPLVNAAPISGRCRPQPALSAPVHIVTSWPHMNGRGRYARAEIDRAGGAKDTLFDKPFSVQYQSVYSTPAVLNPGDSILTTCTFENLDPYTVSYGERATDEVCFNLTVAYPANALVGGGVKTGSCISAP